MSLRRISVRAALTATARLGHPLPMLAAATCGVLTTLPAHAATLQPVSNWGASGVPTYISMYIYVPDKLATNPPIVVAAHYCGGNAQGEFGLASSVVSGADKYGFIMIFPQTSNNCWDVGSAKSLTHDGGGDTQAVAEMVKYTITKYNADADRVYVLGSSSGGMMTQALLGVYPDIFKAGASFSGVPDGCWSAGFTTCTPSSCWSGSCAGGSVSKTAQQWGDLVRAQFPGYTGPRPRVQLWHGDKDGTISYNNQAEAIKEWTNVLGLSATPTSTDNSMSGFTGQIWKNSCGFTVLEAYDDVGYGSGSNHAVPVQGDAVIQFFGLDKTGPDPGVTACGDGGASTSGGTTGGTSGSGGGTAGATTSGTATTTTGGGTSGGASTGTGGGITTTGGASGTTGSVSGSDGGSAATSSGNSTASAGGTSSTGTNGGGATSSGATSAGGSTAAGATSTGSGGSTAAGATSTGSGASTGGSATDAGSAGSDTNSDAGSSSGCSCRVAGGRDAEQRTGGGLPAAAGLAALLGLALSRRRRNRQ